VQDVDKAPAIVMGPYLLRSGKISLLRTISIYSLRGESREQIRLLYVNAPAIQVWEEMEEHPRYLALKFASLTPRS
jgi:hypothetical protein